MEYFYCIGCGSWRGNVCDFHSISQQIVAAKFEVAYAELQDIRACESPEEKRDSNSVSHPAHYNSGKIEVIEALEDWKLDFHCANAVKYVARAGKKDPTKEMEDLEKAVWYLRRKIELLNAAAGCRDPKRPNDMVKK